MAKEYDSDEDWPPRQTSRHSAHETKQLSRITRQKLAADRRLFAALDAAELFDLLEGHTERPGLPADGRKQLKEGEDDEPIPLS